MAWSGFGQMHPNLEASQCTGIIRPGFWQDANGPLPVFQSDKVAFFHRHPGSYCTKPAVLGLGQVDLVQKQGGVRESSDLLLANTSELIWTGCEMHLAHLDLLG